MDNSKIPPCIIKHHTYESNIELEQNSSINITNDNIELNESKNQLINLNESIKKIVKKKKNRCSYCNKKIGLLKLNCRCSTTLLFCSSCILPEIHSCTYDYKSDKKKLMEKLVKVTNEKVIKI